MNNKDKEMAELYYNMYLGCLKYQEQKTTKKINCYQYFENFKNFSEKYIDSKTVNNSIINNDIVNSKTY